MKRREVRVNEHKIVNSDKIADFSYQAMVDAVSWKARSECPRGAFERMKLDVHCEAGWVQFQASEGYEADKGRWIGREIMWCLKHDEAIALRDFLNTYLPESVEKQDVA